MTVDTIFWLTISFLIILLTTIKVLKIEIGFKYETLLLFLVLFIPLGLVMDFVHESGHALWGMAVGGRLTYMQLAYFEIYPKFAVTSQFVLGCVEVEGLSGFNYGFMLLGGSMTTNIASWLLAIVLLRTKFGFKTQLGLRIMGLFGLLDLPFYVIFPQMGLQHWIFLGGCQPEPLMGARMMGIPDPAFHVLVFFTTLGLIFLYFKPALNKVFDKIISFSKGHQNQ